jgi:hypothetical protein
MRTVTLAILIAATAALPATARRARAPVPVDSQSIRLGTTVVTRPFGAELVDRLALVGSYRLHGRRVHLVRGDAGGACPARYVFVTDQSGGAPIVSAPFGSCSAGARVRASTTALEIAMPSTSPGMVARYAFDGTTVRPVDASGIAQVEECPSPSRVDTATQVEAVAAFERDYPAEFRSRGALGRVEIDGEEMRSLVIALACLAPLPAAEQRVPTIATPLFASRHGRAAFATLAGVADDPGSSTHLRASARSFAAEMTYRLARREPL